MKKAKIDNEACEFCGNVEYEISATLITCTRCGSTYGRVNGAWKVDSEQRKGSTQESQGNE